MTHDQAAQLCNLFPPNAYTTETGYGRTESGSSLCASLKSLFPEFNWRVILDRSGERTRWALTVDDNDPREHYFDRLGGKCVHCQKTARELSLGEEVVDDDGGAIAVILEAARKEVQPIVAREREGEHISGETMNMILR